MSQPDMQSLFELPGPRKRMDEREREEMEKGRKKNFEKGQNANKIEINGREEGRKRSPSLPDLHRPIHLLCFDTASKARPRRYETVRALSVLSWTVLNCFLFVLGKVCLLVSSGFLLPRPDLLDWLHNRVFPCEHAVAGE
ncbi:hypothetical protein MGYG_02298 [Nannizzia gypsea CBS 118893]|uniref:Uncharacterized protein n=1 Tax=Arthroderma gypseum (strain ATCC MYA-4604 / CBS 118893) TaxID=535722 RepID=E4UQW0_ARTGP|nr:hypothetical protein MGYG_02298 [Nannizzia gypsea CBS 118893]EFQ99286.1 hypothetical protein MGYG_02298 [Nannizzia gypsea CBS 118893]